MRVAIVAFGFADYLASFAPALARRARVTLFLPRADAGPHAAALGEALDLRLYDQPRLRNGAGYLRFIVGDVLREVRRARPDVLHVQGGNFWLNPLLRAVRRPAVVVTCHDPRPHTGDALSRKTPTWIMDAGFRRADAVLVHGAVLRDELVRLAGLRPERVHVVPMPANMDLGGVVAPPPAGPPRVLFFGRIWPYKGLEDLVRAQPAVTAAVPDARFVIAGTGEPLDRYRALMVDPGRFEVHDAFIPHDLRDELFRGATVVALPYTDATQSGVIPLAYGHGRPVVATRVGALPDLVVEGRTGHLVPPGDTPALAAALIRVLRDPGNAARLGAAGRALLESRHGPQDAADAHMRAYAAAMAARR
ncbi:MAG: glycosyltransferase family 4 protein [Thermoleophilia bacterium]|nr:glycosyltransferase family 4 protein [Thermoleophilia bacterium]